MTGLTLLWWWPPAAQALEQLVAAAAPPDGGLPPWFQVVSAVLGSAGLLGGVAALVMIPANRRKVQADTASQLSDAALKIAENADARADRLDDKVAAVTAAADARVAEAQQRAEGAEAQARDAARRAWRSEQLVEALEHQVGELRAQLHALARAAPAASGPAATVPATPPLPTQEIAVEQHDTDTGDLVGGPGSEPDPVPEDVTDPAHEDYVDPAGEATPVEPLDDFEEL